MRITIKFMYACSISCSAKPIKYFSWSYLWLIFLQIITSINLGNIANTIRANKILAVNSQPTSLNLDNIQQIQSPQLYSQQFNSITRKKIVTFHLLITLRRIWSSDTKRWCAQNDTINSNHKPRIGINETHKDLIFLVFCV